MHSDLVPVLGMLFGIGVPCSIPIVMIVLSHQRKMAEIMHGKKSHIDHEQIASMQRELGELREIVHNHVLAAEGLAGAPSLREPEPLLRHVRAE